MAAPDIPTLPTAPAPTDNKTVFNSKAFAWVSALTGWTTAVNSLVTWMNTYIDRYTVITKADAATFLLAADAGAYIRLTSDSAKTVSVGELVALPVGTFWNYVNDGTSDLTFAAGVGITLIAPAGGTLVVPQNGVVSIVYEYDLTYRLIGLTVAA